MLKETIKYTDFNDVEQTLDCYFHLTKSELKKMEAHTNGGLSNRINVAIANDDLHTLFDIFEELILNSYGIKSADGSSFIKIDVKDGHRLSDDFKQTAAYDALFDKLSSDEDAAVNFIKGVIPASLQQESSK